MNDHERNFHDEQTGDEHTTNNEYTDQVDQQKEPQMELSTVIVTINAQFLRRVDLNVPSLPGVSLPEASTSAQ